jgi:DNA helicase-2/ATP-dependent DNA helicase PcrA
LENYAQTFEEFLQQIDFFEGLKERYPKDWMEREENVKELLRYLREKAMEGYRLEEVLQEVSLLLLEDEEKGQGVRLMTIHASKGLEFSVVFIPRLEEGILPHEKSLERPERIRRREETPLCSHHKGKGPAVYELCEGQRECPQAGFFQT